MKQKKSKFLTLMFSMMFGAGQMYMGFMKQGLSIMGCTLAIMGIGNITQLGIVYLILPLLWFYSFFDCLNKRALTEEEFKELKDVSIFPFEMNTQRMKVYIEKYQIYIGGGFIFLGICILNNSVLSYVFPGSWFLLRVVGPQFFISVVIITIGVHMILSKRQELFSLWKFQKNTTEEYFKSEVANESVIEEAESEKSAAEEIRAQEHLMKDMENHNFTLPLNTENTVAMAMFQPDIPKNQSLDDSLNIEIAK